MKKTLMTSTFIVFGVAIGVASTLAVQNFHKTERVESAGLEKRPKSFHSQFQKFFSDDFFASDPFEEMQKMRERMREGFFRDDDLLFDNFGGGFGNLRLKGNNVSVETRESDEFLIYEISGEGIDEKSIDIKVSDGMITISGRVDQKATTDESGSASSYVVSSSFSQSFSIPRDVDSDKVKMEHVDGKILIKFPKMTQTI